MPWKPYKTIVYAKIAGQSCSILKKKNNKKQKRENMYKQRNSNIPGLAKIMTFFNLNQIYQLTFCNGESQ